jgi:uncharacterized membrane protein YccC
VPDASTSSHRPAVHDARSSAFRKGLRAAIALPGVLGLVDAVTGNENAALFAAFAAFALVAMADFGGPPGARAVAYVSATLAGAFLIAVGTLVSNEPVVAGVVGFVVGFVLMQTAAFGGAWAAGMFVSALSYVLAATFEGTAGDIPERVLGWSFGGLVALALALLFLPVYDRPALWSAAADALRACAAYVRAAGSPETCNAARDAVRRLHLAYAAAPYRPAGPAVRDRAFVALMEGVDRLVSIEPEAVGGPTEDAGARLRTATASLLDAAATRIEDADAPDPELLTVDRARHEHREALGAWAQTALRDGTAPSDVLTGVEGAWWTRVMSFLAISLAADVVIGVGGTPLDDRLAATLETPIEEERSRAARVRRVVRGNLDFASVRFQNAVRTAVAVGGAVLLAGLLSLDHGFWVGLATLSVLRSNALATGRTAVQAVGGTVLGFVVVLVFFGIFDAGTTEEWIFMPIAAFGAAYAPSAISFVVGQASFTVAIVLLFDVILPEGWHTGLVRVEDIAIGAGVSLVVGLLLWPRGARGMLRSVLGTHLRADADYLDEAMQGISEGSITNAEPCRESARRAARRVGDAYDDLMSAPGTVPPGIAAWAAVAGSARQVQAACDLFIAQVQLGFIVAGYPDAVTALRRESDELTAALRAQADAVGGGRTAPPVPVEPSAARRQAEVDVLDQWRGRDDADVSAAVGVVWASEVLHAADLAVRRAGDAISAVSTEGDAPA